MIVKDPSAELTYFVNWTKWLGSDTIQTSTWNVPVGLEAVGTPTNTTTHAYVKVKGGTLGETYNLVNTMTTVSGEKEQATILLYIKEK